MTSTRVEEIQAAAQPAIDRYMARLAEHERFSFSMERLTSCRCGWTPPYPDGSKSANRSLGQHVRYAHRDAERLWKIESAEIVREVARR